MARGTYQAAGRKGAGIMIVWRNEMCGKGILEKGREEIKV
jgi:hypothetical protein